MTLNDITKDTDFYTTTSPFVTCLGAFSQERKGFWLPKDDLQDSSSSTETKIRGPPQPVFIITEKTRGKERK